MVTREEFNKILSELSSSANQWASRNRKYFNVSEEGVKLSKWGRRILAELDETPKSTDVSEATVEMDAINPDDKDFLKFLKKNRVKIINKEMDGPGGGHPVITMQGKRKDLETVLADPELGWDDPDLAEYIEESVNEKIKVTKDKFPYIEFKEGGKKYEVEFDQGDIIDDHGNEGKDWYYIGVDQHGDEWEMDVYTDYRDEPEDWFYDTIKRADESVVTEKFVKEFDKAVLDAETEADVLKVYPNAEFYVGKMSHFFGELDKNLFFKAYYAKYYEEDYGKKIKGDFKITSIYSEKGSRYVNLYVHESAVVEKDDVATHLDNLEDAVGKARDFFAIGKELDKGGYKKKYFYSDTMAPSYTIEVDGFKFAIINKKYVDKGDREVGDIAIGLLENMDTNMKKEFTLYESFGDFLSSKGVLNEAINSVLFRSILMNGKEGKHAKKNMSALAKGFYGLAKVALDKIEDEDFIVSNDPQKVFKNYGGSSHILFFVSDNEKENPYYDVNNGSWNDYKVVPGGGILLAAMSGDRQFYTNEWSRWAGGRTWSKNKKGDEGQIGINHKYRGWGASGLNNGKRIAEVSDRVIVLNLELIRQKYSTEQLRSARAEAKAGATAFKSDKDFKAANVARYHKILADKAASLPLDKMVQDAIDKLAKQISDGLAKGEKTQYQEIKIGESPKGREVKARDASQHMSNILDDYARYVDYIRQAEESEARYGERESYYERESKNYAKRVKEKIDKIDSFDYAW